MRRRELTQEEKNLVNKEVRIDDETAIKEFVRSRRLRNVRETTIRFYEDAFHVLKRDLREVSINKQLIDLTEQDMEEVILLWKQKVRTATINSKLRALKPFYSFLKDKKWIQKDPTEHLKLLRDRKIIKDTLENDEIKKIAAHFKKQNSFVGFRDLVIFQLLLDTGVRINECLNIRLKDIHENKITITETKNLQERAVFISKSVQENLNTYVKIRGQLEHDYLFVNQDNGILQKRTYQERLRKVARVCGIQKKVGPHMCRRTYAKKAVMRGMDPFSLAMLLGHSTLEVTKKYVQIWGPDLEEQSKKKEDLSKYF